MMVNMSAGLAHADISVLWAIFFFIPTCDFLYETHSSAKTAANSLTIPM